MSFVPEFAPDAKSQWRELEVELQELVLDEMERLATNSPAAASNTIIYRDVTYLDRTQKHYVFLRAVVERDRAAVVVIGIAHIARPLS
jgi:hypothetical protein